MHHGPQFGIVLLCALCGACASGGGGTAPVVPRNPGFDGGTQVLGGFTNAVSSVRDSVVAQPRAAVWAVMPSVFETLGIETPTVDPRSFVIGNPGDRVARISGSARLSTYLDCGIGILGPNADRYEVTLQLLVQLAGYPEGGTLVRTTLDAFARPRDSSGEPIHCASQRTLERLIVDLVAAELAGGGRATETSTLSARGRVPIAGDLLRVECLVPQARIRRVGQGLLLGAADGDLLLDVGGGLESLAVPVAHVGRVQVRERRSAAFMVGIGGAVLGLVGGGIEGRSWYDPDAKTHYGQGVFMTGGALAGGVAGLLVGRLIGSFIGTNAWLDAPDDWAGRYSVSTAAPIDPAVAATACEGFDSDG